MQMNHALLVGAMLASIGAMGSGFHEWSEVLRPSFVFGAIGAMGTTIGAFYAKRPNE